MTDVLVLLTGEAILLTLFAIAKLYGRVGAIANGVWVAGASCYVIAYLFSGQLPTEAKQVLFLVVVGSGAVLSFMIMGRWKAR